MSWIQSDFIKSGSAYVPPTWSSGTDEEIVEALEKHYAGEIDLREYWSIGDERIISLSAMAKKDNVSETHVAQDVVFVLTEVGGKYLSDGTTECVFQVDQKDCLKETGCYMASVSSNSGGWRDCDRRKWCNNTYYNSFPSTIKNIFKQFINKSGMGNNTSTGTYETTDYFALRAEREIINSITETAYSVSGEGTQIEWYKTTTNRIKKCEGSGGSGVYVYWLRSPQKSNARNFCYMDATGASNYKQANQTAISIAPFGVI